jgi:hypothetical protein
LYFWSFSIFSKIKRCKRLAASRPKSKIKFEYFEKKLGFVDSFIGTKEFLTNLFDQIYNLMFVKDFKIVILLENGHQHDAEEEEKIKFKDFQKISCFVDSFIRTWAIGSHLSLLKMRYTHNLMIWGEIYGKKTYAREVEEVLGWYCPSFFVNFPAFYTRIDR